MLVLNRRLGEEIVIEKTIRVVVAAIQGNRVRFRICAPPSVRVDRKEVHERRSDESTVAELGNDKFAPSPEVFNTTGAVPVSR